ncbi:conserved hypothetical protein [Leishmania major strain Friedlin]|uniref:G domain-containing protein n=1 Tax=Leishmania major TaxID=5664 RepID=E9AFA0_LEIMA|nr:conserved hypothetical protein [Leishmania major strain Friedlin]CAG9582629.1 hypothetical_protein_-_conserved [Leishmania major strain Friedlin]CBZ12904.1 conserved hypothetical protein [Leishmania major strain Friedlin]|eukprot:XP_003722670.1 conserved hypothetical protein [Leishmania major strain Friedlin]
MHKPTEATRQQWKHRLRERTLQRRRNIASKEAEVQRSLKEVTSSRDLIIAQLADQIFSKGHRHVASAMNIGFVPDGNPATPLVALAGREKCGKTSLLRSLFRSAREVGRSNRHLRRDAMNFFNVGGVFNVVDLPGCGGTSVPWSTVLQHAVLLRNFARCQPSLKMLYYCMDTHYKHGLYIQDIDLLQFLAREVPNFTIVLTKADQINDRAIRTVHMEDIRKELIYHGIHHPVLVTSAFHMGGIDTLRYDMVMSSVHTLPTERLTLTEAQRLSARLFSQKELSTIRPLAIAPSQVDDETREWNEEVRLRERAGDSSVGASVADAAMGTAEDASLVTEATEEELRYSEAESAEFAAADDGTSAAVAPAPARASTAESLLVELALPPEEVPLPVDASRDASSSSTHIPVVFKDHVTQMAYERVVRTLRNRPLLQYVDATSPWRNPLRWPRHVVPTKHPKANIMRCPEAPENPYLFQSQFVAPRADMYFRRPNVGARKSSQKGRYEADKPLAFLVKAYTIPYFPDILDTAMQPTPWAFLGSREAYYECNGGRQLGVRLANYATAGSVNPLSDNPAPQEPELANELQALETKRYGAPIAMLRPPDAKLAPSAFPLDAPSSPTLST